MGIQGLTTFIDANPKLTVYHQLHNTHVVIDGNNLLHCLYHDSGVEHLFGGDYDKFYRRARDYFIVYKKCKITPFIIFDGAYESSDRKFHTTLQRFQDRLENMCRQSKGRCINQRLLPILAMDVLQDVLIDMKIPHAQCDFEADSEIAALANYLRCPVLSLDSDFYIFDIVGGFVPLNTIDIVMKQKTHEESTVCYLECHIYYVDNLLKRFKGISRTVLPLFATVLGNDYVSNKAFYKFYQTAKITNEKSKNLKTSSRQQKIAGLLKWLKSKTIESATEEILECLQAKKRSSTKVLMEQSVKNYKEFNSTLVQALGIDSSGESKPYLLKRKYGKELPVGFSTAFCNMRLPPFLLNAVSLHRVLLLPQVELVNYPSSYESSRHIRRCIYGVLLANDHLDDNLSEHLDEHRTICEYDRVNKEVVKNLLTPEYSLAGLGDLPDLEKLELPNCDVKKIISTVLQADDFCYLLPQNLQLPIMIIMFWIVQAKPEVCLNQIDSLLICLLRLSILNSIHDDNDCNQVYLNSESEQKNASDKHENCNAPVKIDVLEKDDEILQATNFTASEILVAQSHFKKFFLKLDKNSKRVIDAAMLHGFAQFQTCLLYSSILNRLLNYPYPNIRPSKIFNGTFAYSFCKELKKRPYPDLYIAELLGRGSQVDKFYASLKKHILNAASNKGSKPERITILQNGPRHQKVKNVRKKSKSSSNSCQDNKVKTKRKPKQENQVQAFVELNNKFQSLEICDSSDSDDNHDDVSEENEIKV